LFYNTSNSDSKQQVVAEDAWEQLAADEEKTTIYAKVNVQTIESIVKLHCCLRAMFGKLCM